MSAESKQYEIAYLIAPQGNEEDVFGEAGKITGLIQDAKGLIGHIAEPRRIRLTYPIRKTREAHFGWTRFNMAPEHIAEFEKKLKLERAIFRYLIVIPGEEPQRTRMPRVRPLRESILSAGPKAPAPQEEKVDIAELDKRLEEILGK